MTPDEGEARITLRIPGDIKAWLAKRAAANLRSQNAEILMALKTAMLSEQESH